MAAIADIKSPWRARLRPASFRGASFHVDAGQRASGRRVAPHEYPKRNDPYAEDMGRAARRWSITAYVIGPNYDLLRDLLITALEADGPATLLLPSPYLGEDVQALCGPYSMREERERGGFATFEIDFYEAGTPGFSTQVVFTAGQVENSATSLEQSQTSAMQGVDAT